MSGPEYPPPPGPDSNAIGNFEIGVSSIGDISPFDIWETVISQYANSPIITTLLTNFAGYIDQTVNFEQFFDMIMNVDTAQGYGLDVWGRIVGIGRNLQIPVADQYFGFSEAVDFEGFNVAPFYFGSPLTTTYVLADSAYRKLILAKALANICDGSIPAINQLLINLFDTAPRRGNCYVTEGSRELVFFGFAESTTAVGFNQAQFYDGTPSFEPMIMTYTFEFQLTPVELAIVQNSNVLPRPTGVRVLIEQIY